MLALPQRPYFPLGTLRQAVTYPMPAEEVDDACARRWRPPVSATWSTRLDEEAEWSTVLSGGEQQRSALRALIARPTILLLDEAVTTSRTRRRATFYGMLASGCRTIVISIGRSFALADLHTGNIDMTGSPVAQGAAAAAVPLACRACRR